jgi:hypothetical protein
MMLHHQGINHALKQHRSTTHAPDEPPCFAVTRFVACLACVALILLCSPFAAAQLSSSYGLEDADIHVLTRGPLHEAFAEPISFDPEPGPRSPAAPPEPIPEVPPDYRPAGVNVDWIPGYWAWDNEVNDFLWVSGIWRDIPPGREWIAGYWIRSGSGFRWIPGFWADADRSQRLYLPEPPVSVETGPDYAAAPSPDHIWASGTWVWHERRYAWRPGHWVGGRPDWVWMPAHYVWTPRGYVFVEGYWDYDLDRRGVLFAPVRFGRRISQRPQFHYTPRVAIDLRTLTDHLFIRPKHYHYYFGDYFDEHYVNRGFRPWFTAHKSRRVYDPIYAHRRWQHRNDRDWDARLRRDFEYRRKNADARPPRTWTDQRRYVRDRRRAPERDRPDRLRTVIGKTLSQIVNRKHDPFQFSRIDDSQRRQLAQRRADVEKIRSNRRQVEGHTDGKPDRRYRTRTRPAHTPGYTSPIASKPPAQLRKDHQPPKPPPLSKFDNNVQPRRRPAAKQRSKPTQRGDRGDRRKDHGKDKRGDGKKGK